MKGREAFLPVSREDMLARDWYYYDFLLVTGDAYVDHPSFGTAVISRVLEKAGFRVAILSQPDWHSTRDFLAMGAPRLGVLINSGNIDSMVAHYTVAKRRRTKDAYTPGGQPGRRPDRAVIVYSNRAREAFPGLPIIIGGIEASVRRFAHYDYWDNQVRRSILEDSGADLLSYGMGERSMTEIAKRLRRGEPVQSLRDIRGTCFMGHHVTDCVFPDPIVLPSYERVCEDKESYARQLCSSKMSRTLCGDMPSSNHRANGCSFKTRRPCRWKVKSWIRFLTCPMPGIITRTMRPRGRCSH